LCDAKISAVKDPPRQICPPSHQESFVTIIVRKRLSELPILLE
jgi:hypothetical protein